LRSLGVPKARLEMTLVESGDKCVREAEPELKTGRKWSAKKYVVQAKAALQIGDVLGQIQHGRGGFGLSLAPPKWHKADPAQRRKLVVNKVRKQKERMRCKGHFPGQAGRVDEMGECGTTQDGLARTLANGRE